MSKRGKPMEYVGAEFKPVWEKHGPLPWELYGHDCMIGDEAWLDLPSSTRPFFDLHTCYRFAEPTCPDECREKPAAKPAKDPRKQSAATRRRTQAGYTERVTALELDLLAAQNTVAELECMLAQQKLDSEEIKHARHVIARANGDYQALAADYEALVQSNARDAVLLAALAAKVARGNAEFYDRQTWGTK